MLLVQMEAADGVFVRAQFDAQRTRHDFLKHRERKDVVWQTQVSVIRSHRSK